MSISEQQHAANRANAQKSSGPTSEDGKRRSSLNGMRHGLTGATFLMTDADRVAFNTFARPFIEALKPANEVERHFAQLVARDHYRLARIQAIEENTFALGHFGKAANIDTDHEEIHHALTNAQTFSLDARVFQNLSLYEQRINRSMHKNLKALTDLQGQRKAEERQAALEAEKAAAKPKAQAAGAGPQLVETNREQSAGAGLGFVFSDPPKPTPPDTDTRQNAPGQAA